MVQLLTEHDIRSSVSYCMYPKKNSGFKMVLRVNYFYEMNIFVNWKILEYTLTFNVCVSNGGFPTSNVYMIHPIDQISTS